MIDLEKIEDPSFLQNLSKKELKLLPSLIRDFLLQKVSKSGGHLSSNLGVVELTIALHYCFNDPKDKLIFDVGHQTYTHKILTGRAKDFDNLRKLDGLSGYASYKESKYDAWESGHSSTSLSALAGFMKAKENGEPFNHLVSIIGDSSFASGMSFEALNNLGSNKQSNPIIILNDNKMSVSKSVGALNKSFNVLRSNRFFRWIKKIIRIIFPNFINNFFHRILRSFKSLIQRDNIFETMGFDYFGPIDGNDLNQVIRMLNRVKKMNCPVVVHVITKKGKGYIPAENDDIGVFHNIGPFDLTTGLEIKNRPQDYHTYSEIVSETLLRIREHQRFTIINPAMALGTKIKKFSDAYPKDFVDVGIAEEHAATMSAALALNKEAVVLLLYSTFAQRSYDQILNDIARDNLHVIIGIDRAGIVGEDGSTHQGIYDISMLSGMPNMKICMPRNAKECYQAFNYAFSITSPISIRYPRGGESFDPNMIDGKKLDETWEILKEGKKNIIISYGPDLNRIMRIVEENMLDTMVVNARFIKPLDEEMLDKLLKLNIGILVYEQVVYNGSLFSMISSFALNNSYKIKKLHSMSINTNMIINQGTIEESLAKCNLSDVDILKELKEL